MLLIPNQLKPIGQFKLDDDSSSVTSFSSDEDDDLFSVTSFSSSEDCVEGYGGNKEISDTNLSRLDDRAFVVLFANPKKSDLILIVQLMWKKITVAILSDDSGLPWLPVGSLVWTRTVSMKRITEA
jgi:hypothetical protein